MPTLGYTATRNRGITGLYGYKVRKYYYYFIYLFYNFIYYIGGEKSRLCERLYMFLVCAQTTCYYLVWPATMALLPPPLTATITLAVTVLIISLSPLSLSHCHHSRALTSPPSLHRSRCLASQLLLSRCHCSRYLAVTTLAISLSLLSLSCCLALAVTALALSLSLSPTCCTTTGENSCHVTSQLTGSQHQVRKEEGKEGEENKGGE